MTERKLFEKYEKSAEVRRLKNWLGLIGSLAFIFVGLGLPYFDFLHSLNEIRPHTFFLIFGASCLGACMGSWGGSEDHKLLRDAISLLKSEQNEEANLTR